MARRQMWVRVSGVIPALALAMWIWHDGHHWAAAFFFALAAALPLSLLLARLMRHGSLLGLPSVAIQPTILLLLGLILAVAFFEGWGVRQSTGRGFIVLVGDALCARGVYLFAKAMRPKPGDAKPEEE